MKNIEFLLQQLTRYRDKLADFSRRNNELFFKASKSYAINLSKPPPAKKNDDKSEKEKSFVFAPIKVTNGNFDKILASGKLDLTKHMGLEKSPDSEFFKRFDKIRKSDEKFQREYGLSGAWLLGPFLCWRNSLNYDARDLFVSPIFKLPTNISVVKKRFFTLELESDSISFSNSLCLALKKFWDIDLDENNREELSPSQLIEALISKLKAVGIESQIDSEREVLPDKLPRMIKHRDQNGEEIGSRQSTLEDLSTTDKEFYSQITASNFSIVDVLFVDHFNASRMALYSDYQNLLDGDPEHQALSELLLGANGAKIRLPEISGKQLDSYSERLNYFAIDIDSSQHRALVNSQKTATFVIKGPPGTGKSQTITNLIADALKKNEKVLFVSEKRPALDVVFNRLSKSGLEKNAVIIHGSDLDKKAAYQSFNDSFVAKPPAKKREAEFDATAQALEKLKLELGEFRDVLMSEHKASGLYNADIFAILAGFKEMKSMPELGAVASKLSFEKLNRIGEILDLLRSEIAKIPNYVSHSWLYRKNNVLLTESISQKYQSVLVEAKKLEEQLSAIEQSFPQVKLKSKTSIPTSSAECADVIARIKFYKSLLPNLWKLKDLLDQLPLGFKAKLIDGLAAQEALTSIQGLRYSDATGPEFAQVWTTLKSNPSEVQSLQILLTEISKTLSETWKDQDQIEFDADEDQLADLAKYFKVPPGLLDYFTPTYWRMKRIAKYLMKDPKARYDIKVFAKCLQYRKSAREFSGKLAKWETLQQSLGLRLNDLEKVGKTLKQVNLLAAQMKQMQALRIDPSQISNSDIGNREFMLKFSDSLTSLISVAKEIDSKTNSNSFLATAKYESRHLQILNIPAKVDTLISAFGLYEGSMENDIARCEFDLNALAQCQDLWKDHDSKRSAVDLLTKSISSEFEIDPFQEEQLPLNKMKLACKIAVEVVDLQTLTLIDEHLASLQAHAFADAKRKLIQFFVGVAEFSWSELLVGQAVKVWADEIYESNRKLLKLNREFFLENCRKYNALEHAHKLLARDVVNIETAKMREKFVDTTGYELIFKEASKQMRHKAIRQSMENGALEAMMASKPCWLMNPLGISQFLPFKMNMFDVVIFDEASQVRVEDAIPSIYRGKRLIIVGDENQMPPTNFFNSGSDESDDEDDVGSESLLDLAINVAPVEMLSWHYRSRNEVLIAFSNRAFYGGRLIAAPNPQELGAGNTLKAFKIDNATFSHKTGNHVEADAVIAELKTHFANGGSHSVGIIAMGTAQVDALEAALDRAKATDPAFADLVDRAEAFKEEGVNVGLFIKNLENVQGDEREVIFISIGYAPNEPGKKLNQRFGPLSMAGGEKRLNVAITRAKKTMKVFVSFDPSELRDDLSPSAKIFSKWLKYTFAVSGGNSEVALSVLNSFGIGGATTQRKPSKFNLAVKYCLEQRGYKVSTEVGSCGFYIDLAIRHPELPNNFIMGIECDGAMWHSSEYSRDRDKLRETLLKDRGWKIERILSTDWSRNWKTELDRVISSIEEALKKAA